jgi:hypothetical protein
MKPFIVTHAKNQNLSGIAISEHVIPVPSDKAPLGFIVHSFIGVLWEDNRSPSPSYHEPSELVWLEVPGLTDDEEDDADETAADDEGEETENYEEEADDTEHA